jgi:hypothetical protein
MKDLIRQHIDHPAELEDLYRRDPSTFKTEFSVLYEQLQDHVVAKVWYERLKASESTISWGFKNEWLLVIIIAFLAGLVAKFPQLVSIDQDYFFLRNIGFVVFPFLTFYLSWRSGLNAKVISISFVTFFVSAVYINFLPDNPNSDTLVLASIHLPLCLLSIFGFSYLKNEVNSHPQRLGFLRFNGDLAVMMALLAITGGILSALTVGMFSLIDINLEWFFENYVVIWGLPSIPILATYLIKTNPRIVTMVSPVIAKVFTPIVLITLVLYLAAVIVSGKDPYNDREFLLIFNLILIGVMAIILFSIVEASKNHRSRLEAALLLSLSLVTILLNSVALSAILYRVFEFGITPNRLAVLGGNVLILTNLVMVSTHLYLNVFKQEGLDSVGKSITWYLPVYSLWTFIVVFLFPILFGFR